MLKNDKNSWRMLMYLKSVSGDHLGIIRICTSEGHASAKVLPLQ